MNGRGVSLLQPLIANPMQPLFPPLSRAGFASCRVAFRPTLSALAETGASDYHAEAMHRIDIICPRCGTSAEGRDLPGHRRRVVLDDPAIRCTMLFEGKCPFWDKAIMTAWLRFDGLLPSED